MEPTDKILVELTRSEAVVLFEFLARSGEKEGYSIADHAEQRVLWNLENSLESQLWEILDPKYDEILNAARSAIRGEPV